MEEIKVAPKFLTKEQKKLGNALENWLKNVKKTTSIQAIEIDKQRTMKRKEEEEEKRKKREDDFMEKERKEKENKKRKLEKSSYARDFFFGNEGNIWLAIILSFVTAEFRVLATLSQLCYTSFVLLHNKEWVSGLLSKMRNGDVILGIAILQMFFWRGCALLRSR